MGISRYNTQAHTQTKTEKQNEKEKMMDDDVEGWRMETVEEGKCKGEKIKERTLRKSSFAPSTQEHIG